MDTVRLKCSRCNAEFSIYAQFGSKESFDAYEFDPSRWADCYNCNEVMLFKKEDLIQPDWERLEKLKKQYAEKDRESRDRAQDRVARFIGGPRDNELEALRDMPKQLKYPALQPVGIRDYNPDGPFPERIIGPDVVYDRVKYNLPSGIWEYAYVYAR